MTQIFYIGGSPCSGKSSVAASITAKYDFDYLIDERVRQVSRIFGLSTGGS